MNKQILLTAESMLTGMLATIPVQDDGDTAIEVADEEIEAVARRIVRSGRALVNSNEFKTDDILLARFQHFIAMANDEFNNPTPAPAPAVADAG